MSKNINDNSLANLKHYEGKWQSGATRTIRVPVVLADAVLEYARKLDNNIKSSDTSDLKNALPFMGADKDESQQWKDAYTGLDEWHKALMKNLEEMSANKGRSLIAAWIERDNLKETLAETKQQYSTLIASFNAELEACRQQQPSPEIEPLEAADLLNRLKAKRKKVTASLADIEAILEILEE
jgi:hypothetical protein